jgi:SPP1 gp7 family putative phage head morphogenesis protein
VATANEQLRDAATLHAARLELLKNGIVRKVIAVLNRADAVLFADLTRQLAKVEGDAVSIARLDGLLKSVRDLNSEAYRQLQTTLESELKDFAAYEARYQVKTLQSVAPQGITVSAITADQAYSAAYARPFQGRLLREWIQSLDADAAIKIRDTVRTGYLAQETTDQIVRRIRGTRARGYQDGIISINRRNAASVVRTATAHFANATRERVAQANDDIIKGEQYVATLDSLTTPLCASLDSQIFNVGEGPMPPLHFNCRSTRIYVLKSWRELGLDIDDAPIGTRASYNGQVAADETYSKWLGKQPASIQDEFLGAERGKLYRDGEVSFDRFINPEGKFYTLEQLAGREDISL